MFYRRRIEALEKKAEALENKVKVLADKAEELEKNVQYLGNLYRGLACVQQKQEAKPTCKKYKPKKNHGKEDAAAKE